MKYLYFIFFILLMVSGYGQKPQVRYSQDLDYIHAPCGTQLSTSYIQKSDTMFILTSGLQHCNSFIFIDTLYNGDKRKWMKVHEEDSMVYYFYNRSKKIEKPILGRLRYVRKIVVYKNKIKKEKSIFLGNAIVRKYY